ncbi:MAG: hypothetical protein A2583_07285 [Bdellovibrionales bacterium RIFOXYD1_FULL_53_11]|nr:MAG: hypothetical protein A2583_07285 [Bdellovibrionales bacterium RIFOXYD1_FULL_53_11]
MKNVRYKTVLITGAASGIGYYTALEFARARAELILTDVNEKDLKKTADKCEKLGANVLTYVVDVSDRGQVGHMARDIDKKNLSVDILINNAGIGYLGDFCETSYDTWESLVNVNVWGTLHHVYAFLPGMIKKGQGQIVNVSSGQAFFRLPTWGAYTVTKLASGGFSEILHYELAPLGIKVTTVYPYLVNTHFYDTMSTDTFGAKMVKKYMHFFANEPQTVARKVFRAAVKGKRIEMVNVFNYVGYYMRFIPFVPCIVSKVAYWFLGKTPEALGAPKRPGRCAAFKKMVRERRLGFSLDEVMTGEHEFAPGHGPDGKKFMEFRANWGTRHITKWLNPWSRDFMSNHLSGTVTIEGLCKDAPMKGKLELKYFTERKLRYTFAFDVDGKKYEYTGEKVNLWPWNLPVTHTTCYGTLRLAGTDKVVSRSITYFRFCTMPAFLLSTRLC